jgi:hypothetical protein
VVVLALAFGASFLTVNHLNSYQVETETAQAETTPQDQGIQVIEVGEVPQEAASDTLPVENGSVQEQQISPAESQPVADPTTAETVPSGFTLADLQKNHNSFRGPLAQGVSYHKNIPTQWDGVAGTNVLWKSPIPKRGYNSPVIWGDKLFIAGADNQSREVYCYNRADGKLLWTGKADNIPGSPAVPPKVTEDTGLSAPTLTTDGKRVFAIFATGDLIAFDMRKRCGLKTLVFPTIIMVIRRR